MSAIAKLKTTFAKEGKKQQQQEENVYGSLDWALTIQKIQLII